MWFALHSTRRVSEICRLEWHDNDPSNQNGLVHDALQPHEPTAIHKRFRMTREAQDSSWNFRQTPRGTDRTSTPQTHPLAVL